MRPTPRIRGLAAEAAGAVFLLALTILLLALSWRKWPDATVDSGRELYTAWQLSEGALLYRDVDRWYGCLSPYLNALLFRVFGAGLMTLVYANLLVYTGLALTLYGLLRRGWGVGGAITGLAIFTTVFAFSQYVVIGNFNFAFPYSHETTHGFLVCLLLVAALDRWMRHPSSRQAAWAGGWLGLTALLKPEFLLAGGLVTAAAGLWGWRHGSARPTARHGLAWAAAAVLPTLAACLAFSTRVDPAQALDFATRAWHNALFDSQFTGDPILGKMSGFDQPLLHFGEHFRAVVWALALVSGLMAAAVGLHRLEGRARSFLLGGLAASLLAALAWLAGERIAWLFVGKCFAGLLLLYAGILWFTPPGRCRARWEAERVALRWLLAALALGLLTRMLLHGRIYHYGFYQASLAGTLLAAILMVEMPTHLPAGWGRRFSRAAVLTLLLIGGWKLLGHSRLFYAAKTLPLGRGPDRFLTYPESFEPKGAIVGEIVQFLDTRSSREEVLVLPGDQMIQYLARKRSPVAPWVFYSSSIISGLEESLLAQLRQRPPAWVVWFPTDLRDFGIDSYGAPGQPGHQLLAWVARHYQLHLRFPATASAHHPQASLLLRRVSPLVDPAAVP